MIALDVLRALTRDADSATAFADELDTTAGESALLDAHVARTLALLSEVAGSEPDDAQAQARRLSEGLALALQASLMLRHAPSASAGAFIEARLGDDRGSQYGVLPRGTDATGIVARH